MPLNVSVCTAVFSCCFPRILNIHSCCYVYPCIDFGSCDALTVSCCTHTSSLRKAIFDSREAENNGELSQFQGTETAKPLHCQRRSRIRHKCAPPSEKSCEYAVVPEILFCAMREGGKVSSHASAFSKANHAMQA